MPVLPPVYSTTVIPGLRSPRASARSTIESAMRSLYEPVGLKYSSFTHTSAAPPGTTLSRRTSGVFPIAFSICAHVRGRWPLTILMRFPLRLSVHVQLELVAQHVDDLLNVRARTG